MNADKSAYIWLCCSACMEQCTKEYQNNHLPELVVHLNNTGDKTAPCVTGA